jgi:hypothetical protein
MYSFILQEHKETYCIFYKEVTGKSLQTVSLVGSTSAATSTSSGVKRRVQSASKEEPRIKKSKSEQKVCVKIASSPGRFHVFNISACNN